MYLIRSDYAGSVINEINETYSPVGDFRAPEVLLGAPRGTGMDVWNLACLVSSSRYLCSWYRS